MTLRESVISFIKGGPMKHGIALFQEHGHDLQLLRLCKMNPKANRALLERQLAIIAGITANEFNALKHEKRNSKKNITGNRPGNGKTGKPVRIAGDKKADGGQSGERSNAQKLRDQYPFLSRSDCPPELHQLVSMKITAYHNYVEGHRKLFDAAGLDDCLDKAKYVVDNYKENRLIGDELDYYKQHHSILGLHPIFKTYKKIQSYRKDMNVVQLVQKMKNLEHNIWRINDNIKKNERPHLKSKYEQQLSLKNMELSEIKRMLNLE